MVKLATGKLDYLDSKELNPRYQAAKWILETIYKQKLPRTAKSGQRGGSPMPVDEDEGVDPTLGMDEDELKELFKRAGA
mgnify:FL=1